MITLQKLENSVKFTFTESDHYLFNGEIEVPLNSLALIIDKSDMVTFRKANSNDIFISANISEFGMSKAALEQWYVENMVDSGISEEEVEEAINTALSYYYDADEVDDLIENFYDGVEYDSTNSRINFKHGTTVKGYIDATPFIVDGMVSNVEISNGYLIITFNTDSGKQPIQIPLTDIFNPDDYYTKTDVNTLLANKQDTLVSGANIKTINNESILGSGNIALNVTVDSALDSGSTNPVENRAIYNKFDEVEGVTARALNSINERLAEKQDTLVAGSGITIENNVISSEGGGLDEDFLQATANALYDLKTEDDAINDKFDDYYNKQASDGKYATKSDVRNTYYNKEYIDDKLLAIAASLNDLNNNFGGLKLVKLSQAEYDALTTKDENTLYIIL